MQYFREAIHVQPNERAWVTYIKAKVTEQNQSFPTLVVGQTGSGKSWSTLRLCQEIDPDFTLDGNWFFRAVEFYKEFNKYYKDKENVKRGKIWVLDEAGVDFSSDDWQSKTNKIFAKVFSTARFRNYIFFGTVPFVDFISKKIRQLMQYRMTANYVEKKKDVERSVIVPRCLQWNSRKEDFYYHKLIKITDDDKEIPINRLLLPKPCKRLRDEYEKRREEFSDNLDAELLQQLEEINEADSTKPLNPEFQQMIDYVKIGKKQDEIAELMGFPKTRIVERMRKLRKRGWDFLYHKNSIKIFNGITKKWEVYPLEKPREYRYPPIPKSLNTSSSKD
jgi:hypothetical protein